MSMSIVDRRLLAAAIAAAVPCGLQAQVPRQTQQIQQNQEIELGRYNGRVDKEVRITLRGSDVSSNTLSGTEMRARYRALAPLPQQEGTVRVGVNAGRGDVSVIQQPSAANNYTAIIRIYDRSGGADVYRLATYFTPTMSTRMGGRGYGRGRGMGMGTLPALHWAGDVDGTVELTWRNGAVSSRTLAGRPPRNVTMRSTGDAAAVINGSTTISDVAVTSREGRGQVEVVQQPTAQNRYTTRVRITDPAGGYGHYNFDVTWR